VASRGAHVNYPNAAGSNVSPREPFKLDIQLQKSVSGSSPIFPGSNNWTSSLSGLAVICNTFQLAAIGLSPNVAAAPGVGDLILGTPVFALDKGSAYRFRGLVGNWQGGAGTDIVLYNDDDGSTINLESASAAGVHPVDILFTATGSKVRILYKATSVALSQPFAGDGLRVVRA
jgi:hypothetical protein